MPEIELNEEQLATIIARAKDQAAEIVESNTPLVLRALASQMKDQPVNDEIKLKVAVAFRHPGPGRWYVETAAEWERKIKEKDALEPASINFNEPMLPGIDMGHGTTVALEVKDTGSLADRCSCGHTRAAHLFDGILCACDNDSCECSSFQLETGFCLCGHGKANHHDNGCSHCKCELFEPANEIPAGDIIDPSYPVVEDDHIGEIIEICSACGHADTQHAMVRNGACSCGCKMMSEPPVGEPTKAEFKAKLIEYLDTYPERIRNLDKIRTAGFGVFLKLYGIDKSLLVLQSPTSAWQLRRFSTKTALANIENDLLARGYLYLPDPNWKDGATKAGFHLLRSRSDGIFSKGLRGVGWCKESDDRGEAGKAAMIAMAAADQKALED
jgi:hypothetical protein